MLPIDFDRRSPPAQRIHRGAPARRLDRGISREALGVSDGAHYPLRAAARGARAGLRRSAPAPGAAPARRPHRARRSRLLREEAAEVLETTPASVNGALLRARKSVERRLPERSQQTSLRVLGDERVRLLAEQFADAFERGDVKAILATLSEDATFQMPPYSGWRKGRRAIADSWLMPGGPGPRLRYAPCRRSTVSSRQLPAGSGRGCPFKRSRFRRARPRRRRVDLRRHRLPGAGKFPTVRLAGADRARRSLAAGVS